MSLRSDLAAVSACMAIAVSSVSCAGKATQPNTPPAGTSGTGVPLVGTYKVAGQDLTYSVSFGDNGQTETVTLTIKSLTDKLMIVVHPDNKQETEFKRLK